MASADDPRHDGTFDASQLEGSSGTRRVCIFRIGSFNVGVDQNMLASRQITKHLRKIEHIIATCIVLPACWAMGFLARPWSGVNKAGHCATGGADEALVQRETPWLSTVPAPITTGLRLGSR